MGAISKVKYVGRILSGVRFEELNKSLTKAKERSGKAKALLFLTCFGARRAMGRGIMIM